MVGPSFGACPWLQLLRSKAEPGAPLTGDLDAGYSGRLVEAIGLNERPSAARIQLIGSTVQDGQPPHRLFVQECP